MLTHTSHITISSTENYTIVTADAYEIFDFLDDHLTELDFEVLFVLMPEDRTQSTWFQLFFSKDHTQEHLYNAIATIPQTEIERIHNISKTSSPTTTNPDA